MTHSKRLFEDMNHLGEWKVTVYWTSVYVVKKRNMVKYFCSVSQSFEITERVQRQ